MAIPLCAAQGKNAINHPNAQSVPCQRAELPVGDTAHRRLSLTPPGSCRSSTIISITMTAILSHHLTTPKAVYNPDGAVTEGYVTRVNRNSCQPASTREFFFHLLQLHFQCSDGRLQICLLSSSSRHSSAQFVGRLCHAVIWEGGETALTL